MGLFFSLVRASGGDVLRVVVVGVVATVSPAESSCSTCSSGCFCSTRTSALPLVSASIGVLTVVVVVLEPSLFLDERFNLDPGRSGRTWPF